MYCEDKKRLTFKRNEKVPELQKLIQTHQGRSSSIHFEVLYKRTQLLQNRRGQYLFSKIVGATCAMYGMYPAFCSLLRESSSTFVLREYITFSPAVKGVFFCFRVHFRYFSRVSLESYGSVADCGRKGE